MSLISEFRLEQSILIAYINTMPQPAHLKDVETGKYLFANQHQLRIYGMNHVDELVGLTIHDIYNLMGERWNKRLVDNVTELEQQAKTLKKPCAISNVAFLGADGLLRCQDIIKLPLLHVNNQRSVFLTTVVETHNNLSSLIIFEYYLMFYTMKNQACLHMMKHLAIDKSFSHLLSVNEIRCLLHMRDDRAYKMVAKKLNICVKTVETHVANIVAKSKYNSVSGILQAMSIGTDNANREAIIIDK